MKKHLLLSAAICLMAGAASAQSFTVDKITYTVTTGNNVAVTKCTANGEVVVPATITDSEGSGETYNVTAIGKEAFKNFSSKVTAVTLPSSITEIGEGAFYYCKMTSINIPDGITEIPSKAFCICI